MCDKNGQVASFGFVSRLVLQVSSRDTYIG